MDGWVDEREPELRQQDRSIFSCKTSRYIKEVGYRAHRLDAERKMKERIWVMSRFLDRATEHHDDILVLFVFLR